ncbi:hypothetical protein Pfo_019013 [Paulownia fortunei]|nr:hypothetical protein Pfo_019013 [Paulownia fortunei]
MPNTTTTTIQTNPQNPTLALKKELLCFYHHRRDSCKIGRQGVARGQFDSHSPFTSPRKTSTSFASRPRLGGRSGSGIFVTYCRVAGDGLLRGRLLWRDEPWRVQLVAGH